MDKFLKIKEVREILNLKETAVRYKIRQGKIIAHNFDGPIRVRQSDLDRYIKFHKTIGEKNKFKK